MNTKILISLVLLLVLSSSAFALSTTAQGYVYITIVNNPPKLTNVHLDSRYNCAAKVVDEDPATTNIEQRWFANGEPVEKSRIKYGDYVRCELTPIDSSGEEGATYTLEFKMPKPKAQFAHVILNML